MVAPRSPLIARHALVTGAGSGIGRATAFRLAGDGAAVSVLDVRYEAAEEVAKAIVSCDGTALALGTDVGDEAAVVHALDQTVEALGGLDTAVTCAGITTAASTHDLSLEAWETVLRVNLTGTFLTLKHAIPHLLAAGGGAIVTIGSVGSLVAAGRTSAYDASKGGVLQLTRAVAVEYADAAIRANCVCPGVVATGLAANSREVTGLGTHAAAPVVSRIQIPMARAADPAEIASVVAFLCSDAASFITGSAVPVDGGYTAI